MWQRGLIVWAALIGVVAAQEFQAGTHLTKPIIGDKLALDEVIAFCETRVSSVPTFKTVDEYRAWEAETRERTLREVVFKGKAAAWRSFKGQVDWLEETLPGTGYRLKKLRFEVLPGMWVPAVLYEPEHLTAKVPVFLNVNGHDKDGKAADYKQLRCINLAKRGIITLNLEWFGMGQLRTPGFSHAAQNQLDLCGTSGVAPHFLAMHRAIDILLEHPNADASRVGVSGLSGGGWQTIFISSLDPRVTLANPVAGYSSFVTRARNPSDLGDSEQTPTDLGKHADYAVLTSMLAPRAALLTFNATDNCCFAAPHALPPLMDAARPIYRLFGKELNLRTHVNYVPGDHNFGLENREALYRTIGDVFYPGDKTYPRSEIVSDSELRKAEELNVPLPDNNVDFNMLATKIAEALPRPLAKDEARAKLKAIVNAPNYTVTAKMEDTTAENGISITRWRLRVADDWTVPAVEFVPASPVGTTLLIADKGRESVADDVQKLLAAKHRVIAFDPYYFGESKLGRRDYLYSLLIATTGHRPLGIQAAQTIAVAKWAKSNAGNKDITLRSIGPRTGVIIAVAGALEPTAFTGVLSRDGLMSLKTLIEKNTLVSEMPELFCFGLLEHFDLTDLFDLFALR